jgi:nucleoside-diphosphate-sugar epimerase
MSDGTFLVTGSRGLIGSAVMRCLADRGHAAVGVDLREPEGTRKLDICRPDRVARLIAEAEGIIHLAAVARVGDAEADPQRCRRVNVDATRHLLEAALQAPARPWVLFASSREIYGDQASQPVQEDAVPAPKNVYARSKHAAEGLVEAARRAGLQTAIVRFANVYGSVDDHRDRVVPAFAAAAAHGGVLRVDDPHSRLDFTHVADVADGVERVVARLVDGERDLPPVHFASGEGTTLMELARLAAGVARRETCIAVGTGRECTVKTFIGNPERARTLLGWQATTSLDHGFAALVQDFAGLAAMQPGAAAAAAR